MEPSLLDGDIVFFRKYLKNKSTLKTGQIIIFKHPIDEIHLIKRVKTIKEFSVEVFGDNKKCSTDSDFFGFIQKSKVLGIVTTSISKKNFKILSPFFNL